MSREIKFRAWDDLMKIYVSRCEMTDITSNFYGDQQCCSLSDMVFQQYTGLKDKNGKEIYEGDICNAGMVTGPIDFIIGGFSLASNTLIEFLPKDACVLSPDFDPSWIDVEVVGNVCENPDYFKNNE
jgi:uncharacterized phage protein (TIGR01671 family)